MEPTPSSMPSPTSLMARLASGLSASRPAALQPTTAKKSCWGQGFTRSSSSQKWGCWPAHAVASRPGQLSCKPCNFDAHPSAALFPTHCAGPAASLASAADSAPSARDVPPIRPKLRMRDRATLQGERAPKQEQDWHRWTGGSMNSQEALLLPCHGVTRQRLRRHMQVAPRQRSLEQLAADVLHDAGGEGTLRQSTRGGSVGQ